MKKLLIAALVGLFVIGTSTLASATNIFTFTQVDLLGMVKVADNPSGIGYLTSKTALGNGGVEFYGGINDGNPQFRQIQIGYDKTGVYGQPWGNLSSYTGYGLNFKNNDQQDWVVNLYMNTGYTDSPYNETNRYYQGSWTTLHAGESTSLGIDFSNADSWVNGTHFPNVAAVNLNHMSSIGFSLAFNDPNISGGNYQGDQYHMQVSPVPEPTSMLLLGMGILGLFGLGRKKKA